MTCQIKIHTVPILNEANVEKHMYKKYTCNDDRAIRIAQLDDSNLNLVIKLLDNEEDEITERFTEWMRACFKRNYGALVGFAEAYHALDKLSQRNVMTYSINMMRETMLHGAGASSINRTRGDELKFVQDFSKVMTLEKIEQSFKLINDASYHLERNGSAKMIFLDLSLKLSKTLNP